MNRAKLCLNVKLRPETEQSLGGPSGVRVEEGAASGAADVVAAYRLEERDLDLSGEVLGESGAAAKVARLWSAVRRIETARMMVLRDGSRTWIAAGNLLIEGQAGLNIGLLMSSLRQEMHEVVSPILPQVVPPGTYRKIVWGLATRMARVEVDRVLLLDTGETQAISVARAGFALPPGVSPATIRKKLSDAVEAGRAVRYSLGDDGGVTWGPRYALAHLFGEPPTGAEIRLSNDGWPESVPETASLVKVTLAMNLAGHVTGCSPESSLQVLDATLRSVASVSKETDRWAVCLPTEEVRL